MSASTDYPAIPYRAETGFSLFSNFHREIPVFITGISQGNK
jgi:hypothetical protein